MIPDEFLHIRLGRAPQVAVDVEHAGASDMEHDEPNLHQTESGMKRKSKRS
jgi:hypothetical protein